jgi:hypothetical protein
MSAMGRKRTVCIRPIADLRLGRHTCRMNKAAIFPTAAAICLIASCGGPSSERYVIVGQAPFYHDVLAYQPDSEQRIVGAVQAFAKEHHMDFLGGPGHPSLDSGQFNLTAAGPNLNLGAIRVSTSLPNTDVFAIARGQPTANDRALTAEFVDRLKRAQQAKVPR